MVSKDKRYSEEQFIRILKEVEIGTSVSEVCRKYGVAEQTVYRWRSKYEGVDIINLVTCGDCIGLIVLLPAELYSSITRQNR